MNAYRYVLDAAFTLCSCFSFPIPGKTATDKECEGCSWEQLILLFSSFFLTSLVRF